MFIVAVSVRVKQGMEAQFAAASLDNARGTRREPGNIRFDVIQAEEDPARFMLYEVYKSKDDFVRHQQTEHYTKWKQTVADWMAQPREGIKCRAVFFGDDIVQA